MTDAELIGLTVWGEARGEPDDGRAAVARVILNREAAHFQSDGSLTGTIFHPEAFSEYWYTFAANKYRRVAWTLPEAQALANKLYVQAAPTTSFRQCMEISASVVARTYGGGPEYQKLGTRAVQYDNLSVSKPSWATPDKLLAVIGQHSFFHA